MSNSNPRIPASRIVVMMPNWLGDGVMATPFLRALRGLYPVAHIAAVAVPLVAPVLAGLPYVNDVRVAAKKEKVSGWIRDGKFDLGILLPNSFRSAWSLFRGGVPRRLGYARDRRSVLLTDRVMPVRRTRERREADEQRASVIDKAGGGGVAVGSAFEPVPTIDYYLELVKYLGAENPPRGMELAVTEAERTEAEGVLSQLKIENSKSKIENYVVLVPGANFGASKCWPPERFAALSQALADPDSAFNARVLLATSPSERPIAKAIQGDVQKHRDRVHLLAEVNEGRGISVGALKEIVRRSRLMICNDTGPRHYAAAFGVPTVTLFGPTDPVWAETYSPCETIVRAPVACAPCQLKQCPIDHRCMKGIRVEMVVEAARERWEGANSEFRVQNSE